MKYSSQLIENAVAQFAKLPGVGNKSALRLVLTLLNWEPGEVDAFNEAIHKMKHEVQFCVHCHNISDATECVICSNPLRNRQQICVVESIRDVIAIESTAQYQGLYHVLGGVISPIDGIGPDNLNIGTLVEAIKRNEATELIMALSPTIAGDTTVFYIAKMVKETGVVLTTIARGIAFGGELQYADEMTLARSIAKRMPIDNYVNI